MLDANNAWQDLPTAVQYMRRLDEFHPYWIEEPFSPDDMDNHAALARHTPTMIATGEIEAGRWRFKELLEKRAAAIPPKRRNRVRRHHRMAAHHADRSKLRCIGLAARVARHAFASGRKRTQCQLCRIHA